MTLRVAVVVPTRGRPALLSRCLDALLRQEFAAAEFEIVVVVDGPSHGMSCWEDGWRQRTRVDGPDVRFIHLSRPRGPAAARNAGWRSSDAPLIAFTDDDCVPAPGWLRAGVTACRCGADAVSGRVVVPLNTVHTDYERNAALLGSATFVTASCFCRRACLQSIDGFDERFTVPWREDTDLYFRLLKAGARVVNAPNAVVEHPVRPATWGVSLGQQRKSMYNALLYKKHQALYRSLVQSGPPWRYYLTVAALLMVGVGRALKRPWFATGCGVLWSTLTARFCLQRLSGTSTAPLHVLEMAVTSALIPPLAIFWRLRGAIAFRVWFF